MTLGLSIGTGVACWERHAMIGRQKQKREKYSFPHEDLTSAMSRVRAIDAFFAKQQGPGSLGLFPHMNQESIQMCEQMITTVLANKVFHWLLPSTATTKAPRLDWGKLGGRDKDYILYLFLLWGRLFLVFQECSSFEASLTAGAWCINILHLLSICVWHSINTLIGTTSHLTVTAVSFHDKLILNGTKYDGIK